MSFLDLLPASARARLLAMGRLRRLEAGEVLLRRGAPGGDLFLIEQGELEALDARTSPPIVLERLHPGEVIGEIGFLDRGPRTADVRARTACTCRAWPADALREALRADAPLAAAVYEALGSTAATHLRAEGAIRAAGVRPPAPVGTGDPVVIELVELLERAWRHEDEATAAPPLRAALGAIASALTPLAGSLRADAVGAALLDAMGERLALARTGGLLLSRRPGTPAGPALWQHLAAAQPAGASPRAQALDAALLALPALAGATWRVEAHAEALAAVPLAPGDPVLLVAPAHTPLHARLAAAVQARGARLHPLAAHPDGAADPDALLALARGQAPPDLPPARLVVVEALPDVLPDRLLAGLLHTAAGLLAPGGHLHLGHTLPSPDLALLDHLLRWPLLPRTPDELARLLAATPGLVPAPGLPAPPGVAAALACATARST